MPDDAEAARAARRTRASSGTPRGLQPDQHVEQQVGRLVGDVRRRRSAGSASTSSPRLLGDLADDLRQAPRRAATRRRTSRGARAGAGRSPRRRARASPTSGSRGPSSSTSAPSSPRRRGGRNTRSCRCGRRARRGRPAYEHDVAVAVDAHLATASVLPERLALLPRAPGASGSRSARAGRSGQRSASPFTQASMRTMPGARVLHDHRHQPVRVELDRAERAVGPASATASTFSHRDAARAQVIVRLADGGLAEVEDRRRQHRVGVPLGDPLGRGARALPTPPDAITGIGTPIGDRARQLEVEPVARAVAVHAGEQDLARAQRAPSARTRRSRRGRSACGRRG